MEDISIVIHSYSSPSLVSCIETALTVTKKIYVIGEEKRAEVKNFLLKNSVHLINFPNQGIVEPARNFGIRQVNTRWVFLLDADEQITRRLAQEIKDTIKNKPVEYYQVPRKEVIFSKYWLKYGGWYPNYQTRLIKMSEFVNWPTHVHATPEIKGKKGTLKNHLLHLSQNDISELVERTVKFEGAEANLLFKAGRQSGTGIFFRKFFGELYRRLFKWQGFRDGTVGIIESIYQAFSKTVTYILLYEKQHPQNRVVQSIS